MANAKDVASTSVAVARAVAGQKIHRSEATTTTTAPVHEVDLTKDNIQTKADGANDFNATDYVLSNTKSRIHQPLEPGSPTSRRPQGSIEDDVCGHLSGLEHASTRPGTTAVYDAEENDCHPVERAAPRRYEDDDHENDHDVERLRLIPGSSVDNVYSDSDITRPRVRGGQAPNSLQQTSSMTWSLQSGLHPSTWNRQTYIKAGMLSLLLVLIILSLTVFRIQDHIKDILRYIDDHKRIGVALFIVSYTLACTLFLPGSLFTIGAGFLFKPFPLALLIVLLGDVVAAVGSFIFGRYVFYDWVKEMMSRHPKFTALDQVIRDDGWKIVVMMRLTPIPFSLITYFFSITSIRLWTVVWGTCIGVLPGSCIGIWIGSLLKGLSGIEHPDLETKNMVILIMNVVFIACCIMMLSLFGKRSLRKAMKQLDQHQDLTNLQEVEVLVEGVATVVRELENASSIPPSLRSTMVERQAAENGNTANPHTVESASKPTGGVSSFGFTRGEKIAFVFIGVVALMNVCVCVPLFYHYAANK